LSMAWITLASSVILLSLNKRTKDTISSLSFYSPHATQQVPVKVILQTKDTERIQQRR
jgi:hypothetical protein